MRKFKIGCRVVYTGGHVGWLGDKNMIGCEGTVNGFEKDITPTNVPVLFDTYRRDGSSRQYGVFPDNIRSLECEKAKELT